MAKRYVLTSEINRVSKKHPHFELQLPAVEVDGVNKPRIEITIPAAQMLPDNVVELAATAPVRAAQILLGDNYAQFKAGGGTASLLFQIIQENGEAELGESSASADS